MMFSIFLAKRKLLLFTINVILLNIEKLDFTNDLIEPETFCEINNAAACYALSENKFLDYHKYENKTQHKNNIINNNKNFSLIIAFQMNQTWFEMLIWIHKFNSQYQLVINLSEDNFLGNDLVFLIEKFNENLTQLNFGYNQYRLSDDNDKKRENVFKKLSLLNEINQNCLVNTDKVTSFMELKKISCSNVIIIKSKLNNKKLIQSIKKQMNAITILTIDKDQINFGIDLTSYMYNLLITFDNKSNQNNIDQINNNNNKQIAIIENINKIKLNDYYQDCILNQCYGLRGNSDEKNFCIKNKNCKILIVLIHTNLKQLKFKLIVFASLINYLNNWFAFAFSLDEKMGNDFVFILESMLTKFNFYTGYTNDRKELIKLDLIHGQANYTDGVLIATARIDHLLVKHSEFYYYINTPFLNLPINKAFILVAYGAFDKHLQPAYHTERGCTNCPANIAARALIIEQKDSNQFESPIDDNSISAGILVATFLASVAAIAIIFFLAKYVFPLNGE